MLSDIVYDEYITEVPTAAYVGNLSDITSTDLITEIKAFISAVFKAFKKIR